MHDWVKYTYVAVMLMKAVNKSNQLKRKHTNAFLLFFYFTFIIITLLMIIVCGM